MKTLLKLLFALSLAILATKAKADTCPTRPASGSIVADPQILTSQNGALTLNLTMANSPQANGIMMYCYLYGDGTTEAPTLQVNPGDTITINLTNHLTSTAHALARPEFHMMAGTPSANPCTGGTMTSSSTNIHFHGLNIPPKCHQDEIIKTSIPSNAPPFQYKFTIPANEPAGLYWYHPHPHGFTKTQVIGGAAGALIVGGLEAQRPETAGLPQRVFIIRQQQQPGGSDESSVLSINFVPFHELLYARILMHPGEQQLWRLLNATSTQFLQLQLLNEGSPTNVQIVGLDGVPLETPSTTNTVVIPPAGRAEIIVTGPPQDGLYQFFNVGYDTGPAGDPNPAQLIANVVPDNSAPAPARMPQAMSMEGRTPSSVQRPGSIGPQSNHTTKDSNSKKSETKPAPKRFANLAQQVPTKKRNLYFSETDDGSAFFLTVVGQTPRVYDPAEPPAITTRQGAIEDWTLENRTTEVHAFHLHQLHFVVLEINGKPTNDPAIRDTVVIPYWDGVSPQYTKIKIRIDFRDPETLGTFLYHCHILDHEDGGMMAKIRVLPPFK